MTSKSTHKILTEIGFKSELQCPYCGDYVPHENASCCGEVGRAQHFYKEEKDNEWLSEADAISRVESDNRAEIYFSNEATKLAVEKKSRATLS